MTSSSWKEIIYFIIKELKQTNKCRTVLVFNSVWGQKPDLTREGGSIPVTVTLQTATGADVMLLPIGQSDDGAHSQNEKMSENNYINGVRERKI